ncbi:hypothetical protein DACRYDRAFT_111699 [Dacryopinax primogenitus]|uniref:ABM domain-containing protein n=1 Tax=Dacryopinax primogenitus (strain DJM 731) TaxID=1858805 RepID=M5G1P3_DACPD|nr:uncharacterized protein DACRYDRAFT_111699 [Dacryopinax primogenitus]EJT97657.1 hypothetical protein DACRYDRAFT_111699 [Dacryopinax primogenitus]
MSDPNDKRFVVLATLHVNPAKVEAFEKIFRPFVASNRQEPGSIKFDVIVTPDKSEWHMFEVYRDEEAFEAHCDTLHHTEFHRIARDEKDPLFTKPPRVRLDYKIMSGLQLS